MRLYTEVVYRGTQFMHPGVHRPARRWGLKMRELEKKHGDSSNACCYTWAGINFRSQSVIHFLIQCYATFSLEGRAENVGTEIAERIADAGVHGLMTRPFILKVFNLPVQ